MVLIKLICLAGIILLYFGIGVFGPLYSHIPFQGVLCLALLGVHLHKHGQHSTRMALQSLLPFILILLLFGICFDWLTLQGRTDWLRDSLYKSLVFPNSFFLVKLCLEQVTFADILALPGNSSGKRFAIIIKAVMGKTAPFLERYRFFLRLSPHFPQKRARFFRLTAAILALYVSIYRETEKTSALLEHRLQHLHIPSRKT